MKILDAEQTRLADSYTIKHEPIRSIELMERAAISFVVSFYQDYYPRDRIAIVCGTGNNGGDGLAVSRILHKKGYKVQPFVVQPNPGGSADFTTNLAHYASLGEVHYIRDEQDIPDFLDYKIIIDAMFGSGLSREVGGIYAQVIEAINKIKGEAHIIALDIPSGLFVDKPATGAIIQACKTISLQLPKLSFFIPDNFQYVGDWQIVDIGLDQDFINSQETVYSTIEVEDIINFLPRRNKFDHKGVFGHGQLIGGSYGKMGAMSLASMSFIKSGAGLLTLNVPSAGIEIVQTTVPEAMVLEQAGEKVLTNFNILPKVQAIGVGPGMGQAKETIKAFGEFLRENDKPLVLDADAINILSEHRSLLSLLPKGTIITPHLKEFDRLVGDSVNHWQRLEKAIEFAHKWELIIVLKGANSAIINSDRHVVFNITGNPGMATGGSGDVLLGIITSLRTQGLTAIESAIAGTFIHGMAGDFAIERTSMASLIASDIANAIGDVYLELSR